jgi:ferritin-like metal-binding protein YciE
MEALQKLFIDEVADIYDAEHQILKALPKLIEASSSPELQRALKDHLAVTQKQVTRLEQIFRELGEKPGKKCKGMAGVIAEGDEMLKEDLEDSTKDAGIIGAAQRVEHYEIASYGTARTLAATLGHSRIAELLEQSLDEEKEADELLTQIAESSINSEAASEENDGGRSRGRAGAASRRVASSRAKRRSPKGSRDRAKSRR